jgi:hypothetical protein
MSGSATSGSTESMPRFDKSRIWDVVCGGLLIVAASLKVFYPTASGIEGTHGDAFPWSGTTLAVALELLLGWGLVAGVGPKYLRPAAGILFTLFAVYSMHRAVAGFKQCGCFGAVAVPPWVTAAVDLVAAAGLLFLPEDSLLRHSGRTRMAGALAVAIGVPLLWIGLSRVDQLGRGGASSGASENMTILSPDDWVGKDFPITSSIDPATEITKGSWDVLMFHHDCPKCQEVVPVQRAHAAANPSTRLLLLEVPPCGPAPEDSRNVTVAKLNERQSWFVSAPVMIRVVNGVVTSVTTDFD